MRTFFRQLRPAVLILLLATLMCGVVYPLLVTGIGRVFFAGQADGSLIRDNGTVIGSSLIGQPFSGVRYFHPRPSAADDGYGGLGSSGSNLGPQNPDFLKAVGDRVVEYRTTNGLADTQPVPVDAVTASGSGLDPMISVANARLQAARIASARGLDVDRVMEVIADATQDRAFGVLGDDGVVVLTANRALDRLAESSAAPAPAVLLPG